MTAPWPTAQVVPISSKQIVVIGGGFAGLACARTLRMSGCHVVVMEANNELGGRCKQLYDFAPWGPIDLGCEFVHGENATHSPIARLIQEQHWENESLFDITEWGEKGEMVGKDIKDGKVGGVTENEEGKEAGEPGETGEPGKTGKDSGGCRGALAWLPNENGNRRGRLVPLSGSDVPVLLEHTKEMFEEALKQSCLQKKDMTIEQCLSHMPVSNLAVVDSIVAQTEAMNITTSGVQCTSLCV